MCLKGAIYKEGAFAEPKAKQPSDMWLDQPRGDAFLMRATLGIRHMPCGGHVPAGHAKLGPRG